jgi:peroxiredoxin
MPNRGLLLAAVVCAAAVAACAADTPRRSPDFAVTMNAGAPVALSQYKGKVCALAFILTTCPHCQKTVGYLSAMQTEYGPRGFQVLASAIDDMGKMLVPDFINRFKPSFPVGYTSLAEAQLYLQHPTMYRMLMPQLVFIDRKGEIRAQYAGDDKFFAEDQEKRMREQIEALLKEAPAVHKKR